jgi:hypothetical protein
MHGATGLCMRIAETFVLLADARLPPRTARLPPPVAKAVSMGESSAQVRVETWRHLRRTIVATHRPKACVSILRSSVGKSQV